MIPQVIFEKINGNRKIFQRKLSFASFMKTFDINKYIFPKHVNNEDSLLNLLIELQEFFTGSQRLALYKNDIGLLYECLRDILLKTELTDHEVHYIKTNLNLKNATSKDLVIRELNSLINYDESDDDLIPMFSVDLALRCLIVVLRDCKHILTHTDMHKIRGRLQKYKDIMYKEKARQL